MSTTPDRPGITRRHLLQRVAEAVIVAGCAPRFALGQTSAASAAPLPASVLPTGIRSRFVDNVNGLRMHLLEAGFETPGRRAVLMIHGFPELAYSWRNVMGPVAAAGYHVFAPDVRGYGRTSGADAVKYSDDLRPFGTVNKIRDMVALVSSLGYRTVNVVGHDQGSPLAGWCACARPDMFRTVVMSSAPYGGPPALPFNAANAPRPVTPPIDPNAIYAELARLTPPRKHYQRYYQTAEANENMWRAPQGLHAFLRAYYHMKSADWKQNDPRPLAARTAAEWAKLPRYYIMDLDKGMAEQVAPEMPSPAEIAACAWLPDAELRVYSEEYGRNGFQGGLNGYRGSPGDGDLQIFAGRTIDVPSTFISGTRDWGIYQNPGALERLEQSVTTKYQGTHLVDGAGHWVQQEQPKAFSRLLLDFLAENA
jgi:pimeloyl-ACP methyl ester carboxylesterase